MGDGMGVGGRGGPPVVADVRAAAAVPMASPEVADMWAQVSAVTAGEVPAMGLTAGERPAADVEVLCSAVASVEFELARRMTAAARAGSLPLVGDGAMLLARGWSAGWARRLARAGAFVEDHPALAGVWASGVITSEHVHALARHADRVEVEEMSAVITELGPWWGQLSPLAVAQFVAAGDPGPAPAPGPRTGRDRRPRGPVAVIRAHLRLRHPGRGAAPPGGGSGDRRDRRVRRTAALRGRPRPGLRPPR